MLTCRLLVLWWCSYRYSSEAWCNPRTLPFQLLSGSPRALTAQSGDNCHPIQRHDLWHQARSARLKPDPSSLYFALFGQEWQCEKNALRKRGRGSHRQAALPRTPYSARKSVATSMEARIFYIEAWHTCLQERLHDSVFCVSFPPSGFVQSSARKTYIRPSRTNVDGEWLFDGYLPQEMELSPSGSCIQTIRSIIFPSKTATLHTKGVHSLENFQHPCKHYLGSFSA